MSILLMH